VGQFSRNPWLRLYFVLICVIDLAYTIFVQLQSLVVISTHADRQSVNMSITVCLFVNLSFCTVTGFSAGDKDSGVKFCTMVHRRPGHGVSHFGELCSSRSLKSDESAPVLKTFFFKKGTVAKGRVSGHPGHPLDPLLSIKRKNLSKNVK